MRLVWSWWVYGVAIINTAMRQTDESQPASYIVLLSYQQLYIAEPFGRDGVSTAGNSMDMGS